MEFKGKLTQIYKDFDTGRFKIVFELYEGVISEIAKIDKLDLLNVSFGKFHKKRSLDANALLWSCIGKLSQELRADKWEVYLRMLKRYGKFTYICVKPEVVEAVKKQWREVEEIGEVNINGKRAVQLLCYFGSSTYDSSEFSALLDGVISEMHELGIPTPEEEEIKRSLARWELQHQ